MVRDVIDGVIVAAPLVRHLEKAGNLPRPQIVQQIGDLAQSLADALNST